jgi:hypothetical protein
MRPFATYYGRADGKHATTHYELLGVPPTSSAREIRAAYLRRAKDCHPDLHGGETTAEFQKLTHAYAVLSDTSKRARYDANGYRDFDDFSDQEKAKEMFRSRMEAMWKTANWRTMGYQVCRMYLIVYVIAHILVFILDLPMNLLLGVLRMCGGLLGL